MKINIQIKVKDIIPYHEKDNFIKFINDKIKIIENEQNELNKEILNEFKNYDSGFITDIKFNLDMNTLNKVKKYSDMKYIDICDENLYDLLVVTFETNNEYEDFQNILNEYVKECNI